MVDAPFAPYQILVPEVSCRQERWENRGPTNEINVLRFDPFLLMVVFVLKSGLPLLGLSSLMQVYGG